MTGPVVFSLPGHEAMAGLLAKRLGAEWGELQYRKFADGETYLRVMSEVKGRETLVVASLLAPDPQWLPLCFLAGTLHDLGALRTGLVAPYLAYLRQDRVFQSGEALTSKWFARQICSSFDWLVTADPHLHRYHALSEIYSIRSQVVHTAPLLSAWVREHTVNPLVAGPDEESKQWVSQVADEAGAPWISLRKERTGDRKVTVSLPDLSGHQGRTPVLVDDILSTGHTMAKAARRFVEAGLSAPVCLAVHGVFAKGAMEALEAAGVSQILTTNSIPHPTNRLDISPLLAEAVRGLLEGS